MRWHNIQHKDWQVGDKIIREFECKHCGKTVRVVEARDRRTVFCCATCERNFWRHKTGAGKNGNGLSGGMSLGRLIMREKRALS